MRLSCVGNALFDIVSFVETDYSSKLGLHGGSTAHIGRDELEAIIAALPNTAYGAGGGAANTARIFASLGFPSSFAGSVGDDELGTRYRADLSASGVECHLQVARGSTGVFCAMIAPDGKRTVLVNPGVASRLDASAVPDTFFDPESTLYVDGFLAAAPSTVEALFSRAKAAGMRIAFDIAGSRIAEQRKGFFLGLVKEYCSWTFMNEDEFVALAGAGVDEALTEFSAHAPGIVIVKRAEIGAVCVANGSVVESSVRPISATDTTGAGDAFAAGFMAAALSGAPLARCLRLGNRVAEHAIQVPGMAIDKMKLRRAAAGVL